MEQFVVAQAPSVFDTGFFVGVIEFSCDRNRILPMHLKRKKSFPFITSLILNLAETMNGVPKALVETVPFTCLFCLFDCYLLFNFVCAAEQSCVDTQEMRLHWQVPTGFHTKHRYAYCNYNQIKYNYKHRCTHLLRTPMRRQR